MRRLRFSILSAFLLTLAAGSVSGSASAAQAPISAASQSSVESGVPASSSALEPAPKEPSDADPDPQTAIDPSLQGPSSQKLDRVLAREIRRSELFLAALEQRSAKAQAEWAQERERIEDGIVRAAEFAGEVQVYAVGSDRMDQLFERIVTDLTEARRQLRQDLSSLQKPSDVPDLEPGLAIRNLDSPSTAEAVERIRILREQIERARQEMEARAQERRWNRIDRSAIRVERLNAVRMDCLDRLSPGKRRRVLGITTREGIQQLMREWDQLQLSARLGSVRYLRAAKDAPNALQDVFTVGSASWILIKCLFLLALFLFARSQVRPALTALGKYLHEWVGGYPARRRVDASIDVIRVVLPWSLFLILLWALQWALGGWSQRAEVGLALRIAWLYGIYRLAIDVTYSISVSLARLYRLTMDEGRTKKVLRSVRTMMRVIFAILVLLVLSHRLLGNGYLYHRVVQFSWVFVLFAGFLIVARWRSVIADTYLSVGPSGRLAGWVEQTRDQRLGLFVSVAAFAILAGQALMQLGRDFILRYDPVRRMFAFLSRRRMEKQAEIKGYADGDLDEVPEAYRAAFTEKPVDSDVPAIEPFPGMDRFLEMRTGWLADENGASILVSGEQGMGKTTWLKAVDPGEAQLSAIRFNNRIGSVSALAAYLARELELECEHEEGRELRLHDIRKALLDGPKRVVTVNLTQNLFLSKVGGYETFEAFVTLIEDTCAQVFWVCSLNAFARDHLFGVRPDLMVFRHHQELGAWTEDQIHELIRSRNAVAGIEPVYDDLVVETMDRGGQQSRDLKTEEAYDRLLWDYSDGCPRVAIHFWLRSLVFKDGQPPRVRLFRTPPSEELSALGDRSRFLLAAIVVHENLTIREAAQTTRYPEAICRIQIDRMWDREILVRQRGRYRVGTHWHRAVIRSLRRSNLLSG